MADITQVSRDDQPGTSGQDQQNGGGARQGNGYDVQMDAANRKRKESYWMLRDSRQM